MIEFTYKGADERKNRKKKKKHMYIQQCKYTQNSQEKAPYKYIYYHYKCLINTKN